MRILNLFQSFKLWRRFIRWQLFACHAVQPERQSLTEAIKSLSRFKYFGVELFKNELIFKFETHNQLKPNSMNKTTRPQKLTFQKKLFKQTSKTCA